MGLKDDIMTQYNCIADVYDTLFVDKDSAEENAAIAEKLKKLKGSVFEIGCGTGLLLELVNIEPYMYFGCDPSEGMISRFTKKHPEYSDRVACATFEQCENFSQFSNVVATFGSISYVPEDFLHLLAETDCKKFLMFYKPDYEPVTYKKTQVCFFHYRYSEELLKRIFHNCTIEDFNNFLIVSSL